MGILSEPRGREELRRYAYVVRSYRWLQALVEQVLRRGGAPDALAPRTMALLRSDYRTDEYWDQKRVPSDYRVLRMAFEIRDKRPPACCGGGFSIGPLGFAPVHQHLRFQAPQLGIEPVLS